jgi:hypothetical protein
MATLGELHPSELALLQARAKQLSEEVGVEVIIDYVAIKDGRVIAALKAGGSSRAIYDAVPVTAPRNPRWRKGDAS